MSEYWVSHKKYFCKYCNIYIADDAPSRNQHENGLRHKGNVERFVRGLYKAGEKKKHDLEEEKREMVRVEQAAQAAFARDIEAGLVKPGSSSTPIKPTRPVSSQPSTRSSDPYSNYSTAASLGFTDPDAERLQAEAERRKSQGVVGEWEVVEVIEPTASTSASTEEPAAVAGPSTNAGEGVSLKREASAVVINEDEEDGRTFKFKKKKLGAGLGEIYDPGLIPIKLKTKKEEPDEGGVGSSSTPSTSTLYSTTATAAPKWSARGWNKPSEVKVSPASVDPPLAKSATPNPPVKESSSEPPLPPQLSEVKIEEPNTPTSVKVEEPSTTPNPGLFRKRKLPAGGAGSRGRRG